MTELAKIYCVKCGKLLLEATGEGKKICPKCKTENHFITTVALGLLVFEDEKYELQLKSK